MVEIAENFERLAVDFSPALLLVPGLILTAAGLVVWLAGLRFSKIIIAITAAMAGFAAGFFAAGQKIVPAIIMAALFAVLAAIFEKISAAVLAGLLTIIICLAILSEHQNTVEPGRTVPKKIVNVAESVKSLSAFAIDSAKHIKNLAVGTPVSEWAIIAVIALIVFFSMIFLGRMALAIFLSVLGSVHIFKGMILLLLFKGALPITAILAKIPFYSGVFGVMVIFGAFEQLIFCQIPKKKPIIEKSIKDKHD